MKRLIIAGMLFMTTGMLHALTITPTGTQGTVTYQEPGTNTDNSPLDDLDHTTVYRSSGTTAVVISTIAATSPNGNGNISLPVLLPAIPGKVVTYTIWATATDADGNESVRSSTATVRVDKLAPASPK